MHAHSWPGPTFKQPEINLNRGCSFEGLQCYGHSLNSNDLTVYIYFIPHINEVNYIKCTFTDTPRDTVGSTPGHLSKAGVTVK